jgi:hypothetical protein
MEEIGVTNSFIWMDGRNWGHKFLHLDGWKKLGSQIPSFGWMEEIGSQILSFGWMEEIGVTNFFHLDRWKKLGSEILSFGWMEEIGSEILSFGWMEEIGGHILSFHLDRWEGPHLFAYLTLWNVWLLGLGGGPNMWSL